MNTSEKRLVVQFLVSEKQSKNLQRRMTLVYAEKGSSETTAPVHQTTSQMTVFLNCLHRYENPKFYIASNVK